MKKIAILTALFGCFTLANADEVVQLSPAAVTSGVDLLTTEATFTVSIPDGATKYQGVNFDLYLPVGLEVDNEYFEKGSGLPFVSGRGGVTYYHSIGLARQATDPIPGYEHYRFIIYNDKGKYFIDSDLCQIYVTAKSGMAPGVYPIYMEDVKMTTTGEAGSATTFDAVTTYVKVDEGGKIAFEAKGLIPAAVNEGLAGETISTLDLSAVTAVNGDFTYVAGRDVVAPTAAVTADVKFVAPLAGTYSSFCAPVDVTTPCYTLSSCDGTTAIFTEASTAHADEPVLIKAAVNSAAVSATLKSVQSQNITSGYYVASDGAEMHSVKSNATIPALRGYWPLGGGSNLRIAISTTTGIEYIGTAEEVFGNTFDLQGRQSTNSKNGVFVVNGKKQFVK